ncbi:M15 family metallopeptidase [Streptomyces sp. FR-108]|uniref:M15 family metallopeptidase n=1 Tax=Streptomyces sp. FR-108 TaxID=3416665 RepID=UPI003CF2675D
MNGDAGAALNTGALGTTALSDAGVLDGDALDNTTEIVSRSDAGVVKPLLGDPLSNRERTTLEDRFARADSPWDEFIDALLATAHARGFSLNLRSLTVDVILTDPEPDATMSRFGSADDLRALYLALHVADVLRELDLRIEREWEELGPLQEPFRAQAAEPDVRMEPLPYFRRIRTKMHQQGTPDPMRYWREIETDVKIFGVRVRNGVHRELVRRLKAATEKSPSDLTSLNKDASLNEDTTVVGFQPRTIKDKEQLSNHAWGLAIDVDAPWNAYITQRGVMDVIKRHTTDHVDLSKDPIDDRLGARQDREAVLERRYETLKKASYELKVWLAEVEPMEGKLFDAVQRAADELQLAKGTKDQARITQAQLTYEQARKDYEADKGVADYTYLRTHLSGEDLMNWTREGFLNLPLDVIKMIKFKEGVSWGGEYERIKDFMHFELAPSQVPDASR